MNRKKSQGRFVFACLAPAALLILLFIFVPTVKVFKMSLYRMGGITNKKEFVGFENFTKLFQDKAFLEAMQNTILIIVLVMICTIVLAVLLQLYCPEETSKERTFSALFFTSQTF